MISYTVTMTNPLPTASSRATWHDTEILLIRGTPYEQNCVVLVRPQQAVEDRWCIDGQDGPSSQMSHVCKAWWNHYQDAFTLQEFINGILDGLDNVP